MKEDTDRRENEPAYNVLDLIEGFLTRYIAYPDEHSSVAHTLWIMHTYFTGSGWSSLGTSPRLAFLSATPGCGKTRCLEVTELLVGGEPVFGTATGAVLVRLLGKHEKQVEKGELSNDEPLPVLLYDEAEKLYHREADNAEMVSVLNRGYRRGQREYKCAANTNEPEKFPCFCAAAITSTKPLPDAVLTRSIIIRIKKRLSTEHVDPFRHDYAVQETKPIREDISDWISAHGRDVLRAIGENVPVVDREAEIWEPLLAVADAAGGDWPARSREACLFFCSRIGAERENDELRLLVDCKEVFGDSFRLSSELLIQHLVNLPDTPWRDSRCEPIKPRKLASMLKPFGIEPLRWKEGGVSMRGYYAADFADPWARHIQNATTVSADAPDTALKDKAVSGAGSVSGVGSDKPVPDPASGGEAKNPNGNSAVSDASDRERDAEVSSDCAPETDNDPFAQFKNPNHLPSFLDRRGQR